MTLLLWVGQVEKKLFDRKNMWDSGNRWVDWKGVSIKEMAQVLYIYIEFNMSKPNISDYTKHKL